MDIPSFRYFVIFVLGAVLVICSLSELVRWWTRPTEEDNDEPSY